MSVVRWSALVVFCSVMAAFAFDVRSWWLLAVAFVLMLVVAWTCGAFRPEVWFGSADFDAECVRVDAEADAWDRASAVHDSEWGVK